MLLLHVAPQMNRQRGLMIKDHTIAFIEGDRSTTDDERNISFCGLVNIKQSITPKKRERD